MIVKRLPAKKTRILDINNSRYFSGDKESMRPSYVITPFGQKISRVSIVATVIDKFTSEDETFSSINIDDGTDTIRIKAFSDNTKLFDDIELGNLVLAIGKIKEYNGELYINGEAIRKVEPNYENLKKLEILDELIDQKKSVNEIKKLKEKMLETQLIEYVKKFGMDEECLQVVLENLKIEKDIDYKPKIVELINSLDDGEGVEIGKIFEISELPENIIERSINELLSSGSLYEPKPGILKVVEFSK